MSLVLVEKGFDVLSTLNMTHKTNLLCTFLLKKKLRTFYKNLNFL